MAASLARVTRSGLGHFRSNFNGVRWLRTSGAVMGAHDTEFAAMRERVTQLQNDPGNQVKLQLYALFKQASSGQCNTKKPGALDFVGKAKWTAWNELGNISEDEAQKNYIDLVQSLVAAEGGSVTTEDTAATTPSGEYKNIKTATENGVFTLTFNRPSKKNAFSFETYLEIISALKAAGADPNIKIGVLTGTGDFYSSGNDLSNFMRDMNPENIPKMAKEGRDLLLDFIGTIIDFPKPLVALVNGPAIGVACTHLGLCDVVYATEKATFVTPMVELGQGPEGVSSYMFAKLMGQSRANEMLLFGRQITARKAEQWGLVTEVFPDETFHKEVQAKIESFTHLPKNALRMAKKLMRDVDRETLHKVNLAECDQLEKQWQSEECFQAIMAFFQNKSKL